MRVVGKIGDNPTTFARVVAKVGGNPQTIARIMGKVGGAMQQVYPPAGGGGTPVPSTLAVSAMPGSVQGTTSGSNKAGPRTVYTGTVMASASGGTPPYSYAWLKRNGDSQWGIGNQVASSTTFRRTNMNPGDSFAAAFYCVVTDSASTPASVTSNDVAANVDYFVEG